MSESAIPENIEAKGLSPAPYMGASVFMEGYGTRGAKPRPFNPHLAVRQFHHLGYGLAMMNAQAAAGVPLRLFARRRPKNGGRKLYETRPVNKSVSRYFAGNGELKPSPAVQAKLTSWGYEVEEVIEPHPALKVLANPNPNDNGYEMTVDRFLSQQIMGNFWWYVVDSRVGVPQMLFRMPGQWVTVKPNTSKTGANRVAGYVYGKSMANEVEFSEAEVDHFRMPNPRDAGLFYGMGWYEAAWGDLGLVNSKRIEDTASTDNMSRPDWMLSIEGGSQDSLNRLESKVNEKFRGPENAGKFMMMAGKVSATALQYQIKELGTPTRIVETVAFYAGIPVTIILTNDANRSGGEGARMTWYRTTVRSYCLGDEQKLNQRYLSRFKGSEDYLLAYDHVSFEDRAAVTKEVVALVSGGIISPNEARQELGYQEADGADVLYPPAGNTGGSAAILGDASAEQNDERQDRQEELEKPQWPSQITQKRVKSPARMPKVDATKATDESDLQFKRDVYMAVLKDPTAGDGAINQLDTGELTDEVGLKRREGIEMPILPIVSVSGPVVTGGVRRGEGGAIIGGEPGTPPPEPITITRDASAGDKQADNPSDATPKTDTPNA